MARMLNPLRSVKNLKAKHVGKRREHQQHEAHCMSLCCARSGQSVRVTEFAVASGEEAARLRDLGLREGVLVTVVRHGDPLMVRIEDARFGIGRAAATNVLCDALD